MKFDAGYGIHGVVTLGMTEWPILDTILENLGVKGRLTIKRKFVGRVGPNGEFNGMDFNLMKIIEPSNKPKRFRKTVQIIIEKELNCIGCGACLALCPTDALFINEKGKIDLHEDRCKHCYNCLDASSLRGACVARNHKLEVIKVD
ncbi:4Fe-4S dicluster domain-containing protein [Thermococcus sp. P6]|uniref:4Fe-4S dicluster domain-containing protein n=1 Tax=Thermococcus sp. P6 TaxID=122420 RepID=UPI0018E04535|nr:4Fe-4S dicluster domain-containing protein [Thermococcus sp. P6]